LSRKADINAEDNDGATALTYAARDGRADIGRILLNSGATVDAADSHRWTASTDAAVNGHADFAKLLLEKEANPNAREEKGRTPLILTATYAVSPATSMGSAEWPPAWLNSMGAPSFANLHQPACSGPGSLPGAAGGSDRRIAIRTAGRAEWLLRGGRHLCRTSGFRDREVIRFGSLRDLIVARKP
jgi:hypothetical protein